MWNFYGGLSEINLKYLCRTLNECSIAAMFNMYWIAY